MNLKELRHRAGLQQAELAKQLGISLSAYQKYEREERDLPVPVLLKLSKKYGVSLECVVGLQEPSSSILVGDRKRLLDAYDTADGMAKEDAIIFLERHKSDRIKELLRAKIDTL